MVDVIFTNDDKKRLDVLTRMVKYSRAMTNDERDEYTDLVIRRSVVRSQKTCGEETSHSQAKYDATEKWHY